MKKETVVSTWKTHLEGQGMNSCWLVFPMGVINSKKGNDQKDLGSSCSLVVKWYLRRDGEQLMRLEY